MAQGVGDLDSAGVYVGMSLEEFGVRVSTEGADEVPKEQLRESIRHLQEELASGHPLSAEDRTRLERVLAEVTGMIEAEAHDESRVEEFFEEVREASDRFEDSHPNLALVLGRIADALSRLGI